MVYLVLRFVLISLLWALGAWQLAQGIEWYWLVLAVIYTVTLNDIFCHRICSHAMFEINTRSWTYRVLTWMSSADMGYGPVKGSTVLHNLHHMHSDRGPQDVMNWRHWWYATTIVSPLPNFNEIEPSDKYFARQYEKHQTILTDKWTDWCAQHQIAIAVVTNLVLYLLCPLVFFKLICVSRLLLSVMTGIAAVAGHVKQFPLSYRNYNTPDTTSNSLIFYYLFLGYFVGILQNNHHARPNAVRPNHKWWEIDTSLPVVLVLKHCMEAKTNPIGGMKE